jgi:hypothetical protein
VAALQALSAEQFDSSSDISSSRQSALLILQNCRRALSSPGKLLIIESVFQLRIDSRPQTAAPHCAT